MYTKPISYQLLLWDIVMSNEMHRNNNSLVGGTKWTESEILFTRKNSLNIGYCL